MPKIFYQLISPLKKIYWFLFRPETSGVKIVTQYQDEVLMIRNNYGIGNWTFPGGSIDKSESPEKAAVRELAEEVGIENCILRKVGAINSSREYKKDTIYCYTGVVETKLLQANQLEIAEAAWFNRNNLPQDISLIAQEILSL